MKNFCQKYWPALLAWGLLPSLILLFPRGFHGNDDFLILQVLRGGHPAPFIGQGTAFALSWLYAHADGVPWYGLMLYATLCASAHAGVHLLRIIGKGHRTWAAVAGLIFIALVWTFTLHATYTIAAILAMGVALVALAAECRQETLSWKRGLAYGILIAIGYQWRPIGYLAAAAAIGLPGLLFVLWLLWKKRTALAPALLACILPVVTAVTIEKTAPHFFSPAETNYREYNSARGSIQGFDRYNNLTKEEVYGAGWKMFDFKAFMLFCNFDETRYPLEKIKKILPLGNRSSRGTPGSWVLLAEQGSAYGWPMLGFILVCAGMCGGTAKRFGLGIAIAAFQVACTLFVLFWLAKTQRVVARVCLPLCLVSTLTGIVSIWWFSADSWLLGLPSTALRRAQWIGSVLLAVGVSAGTAWKWGKFENSPFRAEFWSKGNATLAKKILQHAPQVQTQTIVEYGCANGFSCGMDPLDANPFPLPLVCLEWVPPSPYFYETLKAAGIARGADLLKAAFARKDIVFLLEDYPGTTVISPETWQSHGFIAQFEQYAQKDIGRPVHFELVHDIHWANTNLYRLVGGASKRFRINGQHPVGSIYPFNAPENKP